MVAAVGSIMLRPMAAIFLLFPHSNKRAAATPAIESPSKKRQVLPNDTSEKLSQTTPRSQVEEFYSLLGPQRSALSLLVAPENRLQNRNRIVMTGLDHL